MSNRIFYRRRISCRILFSSRFQAEFTLDWAIRRIEIGNLLNESLLETEDDNKCFVTCVLNLPL